MSVGERLKSERVRVGLTQTDVADCAGVGKTTVINWEKGASAPDAVQLAALAEVEIDALYVVTGQKTPALRSRYSTALKAVPAAAPVIAMANDEPGYLPGMSAAERTLLQQYRAADAAGRAAIDAVALVAARAAHGLITCPLKLKSLLKSEIRQ